MSSHIKVPLFVLLFLFCSPSRLLAEVPVVQPLPPAQHATLNAMASRFAMANPRLGISRARELASHVLEAAKSFKVEPLIIGALILRESRANISASAGGNHGLMQVNWAAHRKSISSAFSKIRTVPDLMDPRNNIMVGTYLFSGHLKLTGGNMDRALDRYLGRSSSDYRKAVWKDYSDMKSTERRLAGDA